jgi:hypothetical protein
MSRCFDTTPIDDRGVGIVVTTARGLPPPVVRCGAAVPALRSLGSTCEASSRREPPRHVGHPRDHDSIRARRRGVGLHVRDPITGEVVSREFCGGRHVVSSAKLPGRFRIVHEQAVSAGIRRIKAVYS